MTAVVWNYFLKFIMTGKALIITVCGGRTSNSQNTHEKWKYAAAVSPTDEKDRRAFWKEKKKPLLKQVREIKSRRGLMFCFVFTLISLLPWLFPLNYNYIRKSGEFLDNDIRSLICSLFNWILQTRYLILRCSKIIFFVFLLFLLW